jgi:hypothetical protein
MSGMDWEALARAVVARRVELGYPTRNAFIEASGLGARTVGDVETARRDSYARETLIRLERALRWQPGSAQAVLDGDDPKPAADQPAGSELDPRSLERYGDDLELMALVDAAGLSPGEALRVVLWLRKRRDELHRQLVAELRELLAGVPKGEKGRAD